MADAASFLRVIAANPGDDAPRLVYADWLDERGDLRGEWIRYSVEYGHHHLSDPPHADDLLGVRCGDASLDWDALRPTFRRGFVESLQCTLADFMEFGPRVVAAQPVIERVTIADREPRHIVGMFSEYERWQWWDRDQIGERPNDRETLPGEIFKHLAGGDNRGDLRAYSIRAAALSALSDACLAWARAEAGVPAPAWPKPDSPPCRVCKRADGVLVYPDDHGQTVCPDCCDTAEHQDGETGHVWEYDSWERDRVCDRCGIQRRCTEYAYDD